MEKKDNKTTKFSEHFNDQKVIPSVHQRKELLYALEKTNANWIMLKLGDINTLPRLVKLIHQLGKRVMVHQDSIKGIARDKMGIQYMSKCGVDCVITMKPQCIKYIKETTMYAAFGFFVIDSDAFRTGLQNIHDSHPDGVILMPGSIPENLIKEMLDEVSLPFFLGGLITKEEQIIRAHEIGITAVATSNLELWNKN